MIPLGDAGQHEFNDRDKLSRALYEKANGADRALVATDNLSPGGIEHRSSSAAAAIQNTLDAPAMWAEKEIRRGATHPGMPRRSTSIGNGD